MKRTIICSALAFLGIQANAQVEDISVTLSPTASYNWFDNNTAIKDGLMVGGRVGFGFGEYFELRGTYEKSIDLKNTVDKIDGLSDQFKNQFQSRKVGVERIGGEFKGNIPTGGSFAPYLTLGAGVQKLDGDHIPKMEQVFVSGGLGTKINLGDRIVLNLEAKNTMFNLDRANILFRESDKNNFGGLINDTKEERMMNWSALAGLQIYLGGREPGKLTEIDRAYLRKFSGGLSGFKLVLEPGGNYIDFNKNSNYRNTYMLGGAAGFDLNQYIGVRGFYYQATKDEKISTDWDDMSMYGGEILARLNVARGISPYITLGGGYLNVYGNYKGSRAATNQSSYFAKGGLGISVPLGSNFEAFGSANLLYTTEKNTNNLNNIRTPDELMQHTMYNAGLRIKIGATANEDEVLSRKLSEREVRYSKFEDRIDELERELKKAYNDNDSEKAARIIREKRELEGRGNYSNKFDESRVRLTPKELESLVDKVLNDVEKNLSDEERIDRLERLLLRSDNVKSSNGNVTNERILNELEHLNNKIEMYRLNTNAVSQDQDKTTIVSGGNNQPIANTNDNVKSVTQPVAVTDEDGETGIATSMLIDKGWSLNTGVGFGKGTSFNLGIRGHYGFTNSNFEFQPNLTVGLGGASAFGVNANLLYNFDFTRSFIVNPYIGAGIGYNSISNNGNFGANLLVGTSIDVLDGRLYLDYTALDLAKINVVTLGYKFSL